MGKLVFALACALTLFLVHSEPNLEAVNQYDILSITYLPTGIQAVARYGFGEEVPETIIKYLLINVTYDNPQRVRIRITDANNTRWEVPNDMPAYTISGSLQTNFYNVTMDPNLNGFNMQVTRNHDSKLMFNIDWSTLFTYYDQDIFFNNSLGYNINVLGLGERICPFIIPPGNYTLWTNGQPSPYDDGKSQEGNLDGVHPFYMIIEEPTGTAFGGLLFNSNAMSAIVGPQSLTFRTTGGIIDLWLFVGPQPEDVIFQYHQLIGTPALLPYWAYGWHQSRYGYKNVTVLQSVLNNYNAYQLPLDVLWNDIDYMNMFQDFTTDPVNFPQRELYGLILRLGTYNKHYIPIVDIGIQQNLSYATYAEGLSQQIFILSPYSTSQPTPTVGLVWPGNTTFVDWLHENATEFWHGQISSFQNIVPFSGLWIDMNEIENFINGEVGHPPTLINNLTMPWTPGYDLNTNTLDVAAIHAGGVLEYNFHSLNAYYEAKITNAYFTEVLQTRPFVLTRSTFVGSGRYAIKWTGDNYSTWSFMQYSITGVFNFGMFGIPMIGADICGFKGNTTEELCSRWTQLGTLYPFSRNHNDIYSYDQEPWSLGPTLLETNRVSIRNKYLLYLYFYTHMTRLSVEGGTFFKPAFFEYPNQIQLLYNATNSFMLGSALIVHPCLWQGITGTLSEFPDDIWYDLYTGEYIFLDYDNLAYLDMPLNSTINVHVSTGHIIPLVDNYTTAMSSYDTRTSAITLVITQNANYDAIGSVIFDDGQSNENLQTGEYTEVEYQFYSYNSSFDIFTIQLTSFGYQRKSGEWPYISTMKFYGCTAVPETVYMLYQGVTSIITKSVYWDLENNVCIVGLRTGYLQPDILATVLIDYYI